MPGPFDFTRRGRYYRRGQRAWSRMQLIFAGAVCLVLLNACCLLPAGMLGMALDKGKGAATRQHEHHDRPADGDGDKVADEGGAKGVVGPGFVPAGKGGKTVHVKEHVRSDGTHVKEHDRAAPGTGKKK